MLAAAVGLLAGGASNGVYDWPAISNIIDKFSELFGRKKLKSKKFKILQIFVKR